MKKYEIKIIPKVEGFIMTEYEYKTIKSKNLKEHLDKGWSLHRRKYFLITQLLDLWRSLNTDQKISVIAIITGSVIAIIALF